VAYAPPSELDVYKVIYEIVRGIPTRTLFFTQPIKEVIDSLMHFAWEWIIKPLVDGVRNAMSWLFEQIGVLLNSAYQAIVNAVYNFVINPLKALVADALNRIYNKLEGVIFIAVTVPMMVSEAKDLIHNPSLKGLVMFAFKPIIGYITANLVGAIFKPMLAPVTIEPSIPPTVELIPPPHELSITPYDAIFVEDAITLESVPPMAFTELVRTEDYITLETVPPLDFRDYIWITDIETMEIFPPLALSDSIAITDIEDIEIMPPLALTDEITVEDTLIIGV
jgi:hypothetical protein